MFPRPGYTSRRLARLGNALQLFSPPDQVEITSLYDDIMATHGKYCEVVAGCGHPEYATQFARPTPEAKAVIMRYLLREFHHVVKTIRTFEPAAASTPPLQPI